MATQTIERNTLTAKTLIGDPVRNEFKEDLANVFDRSALNARLTADAVQDAARKYLDLNRYVKVTLMPETTP